MMYAVPINGETWLVCGGRDFRDNAVFSSAMSDILGLYGCPSKIVHGGAPGADWLAGMWARHHAIQEIQVLPLWRAHGKAAGPLRNQRMIDEYRPNRVVAFPGGRGTADMKRRAREAGIDVIEIRGKAPAGGAED